MTNPINIIANAMRVADGNHTMGTGQLAEVAANALTDERIVGNAVQALNGTDFDSVFAEEIVLIVLRSVGGS